MATLLISLYFSFMSRTLCPDCHRPQNACICSFTTSVFNSIHVVILQHPSEVGQVKGTVTLLENSLQSCQVLVGDDFSQDVDFLKVLEQYQSFLLYPGENAQTLGSNAISQLMGDKGCEKSKLTEKPLCLVMLDGTWKKAYRMFMLSKNIQQLPQVCLPQTLANAGQYHIRKVAKKNALSSLEACCYALAMLEESSDTGKVSPTNAGKYQPLLEKFHKFNQFQLSFRPEHKAPMRKLDDS